MYSERERERSTLKPMSSVQGEASPFCLLKEYGLENNHENWGRTKNLIVMLNDK